jgi:hypothetical protein
MTDTSKPYAARLTIDYPERLDRLSTAFRLFALIPIAIILSLVTDGCGPVRSPGARDIDSVVVQLRELGVDVPAEVVAEVKLPGDTNTGGAVTGGLFAATLLMLVFRQRYPRWWFEFMRELTRFSARVGAYAALLTDRYPATEDEQGVHLELDAPDAAKLNRWLPLVKWLLAIPHVVVLAFLGVAALLAIVASWFAIVFTGRYPRSLFDFVVGVGRWGLRVQAYAVLLVTDDYPPFSLE